MDKFLSFFTKGNITLLLAILGSIGSVSSWIYTFYKNRKNINMTIIGYKYSDSKSLLLYAMFENKSRLPIAITGICVEINNIYHSCTEIPIIALEETIRQGGNIISHQEYKSMPLPISLDCLGATSGYVYFEFPEEVFQTDSTHLSFRLTTNRGKAFEKILSLGRQLD